MARKPNGEGKLTMKQMVAEAMEHLGMNCKPEPINDYIVQKYQREIPKQQISTYKSLIRKEHGLTRGEDAPAPGRATQSTVRPATGANNDLVLQFVSTVREFESKLGEAKLLEVIHALYKAKA